MAYHTYLNHSGPVDIDPTAWPSSYYGRTKRIDLAKVYSDTLLRVNQEHEQRKQKRKGRRQVSFTTAPPVIHEYEREDSREYCRNRRKYDDAGHLRLQTLDLRPIPNSLYTHPTPGSSVSASAVVTPTTTLPSSSSSSSPTSPSSPPIPQPQTPRLSVSSPARSRRAPSSKSQPSSSLQDNDDEKLQDNGEDEDVLSFKPARRPSISRAFLNLRFYNKK
ncbi:hypothetical protein BDB00DRAFT_872018 [Zychaea mexicana]|uniref:uncharacterized protein n=1 Tax=Zychaea mexicana TaxID=64656 RepID=UPI0022FF2386|nr:uncharacterized protein BDB00DRAFT_872018 [Zychaea mexicana]KAI9493774.1 hypothetical protein BDB00DRAFT_872018 [Zychaea mexicana]